MSHVFHRNSRHDYPWIETGEGCWLIDRNQKRYLDACGGAAVSSLGHQHPAVVQAMHAQINRLAYAHTSFFSSFPAEELADRLVALAPFFGEQPSRRLDRVYLVSSGSEAIEASLKLARQVAIERGEDKRTKFIARRQSYHGNTLGALAVGGNAWRRAPFKDLLMPVTHVSPCYAYRGKQSGETDKLYSERLVTEFERTLVAEDPETVLAFVAEPVVGATLGAVPATEDYFRGIRSVCDRYGVLLILDEVMCGMGRTGSLFAYGQEKVQPDMVTIAKGLGGGYQPIAALMTSQAIHDVIAQGSGFFQHGHTYLGHPVACATALAVLDVMVREHVVDVVPQKGARLMAALERRLSDHPWVGDIRGRGLFVGIELVEDRDTKSPFSPERKLHAKVKQKALDAGLMCYPMGGTLDGQRGDHILLAPPLVMPDHELEEVADRLATVLQDLARVLPR